MVSAVKIGGRRLHELARAGEEVERAPRPVHVDRFDAGRVRARARTRRRRSLVECGSGTYVRSLAADLGAALGGFAHLAELRRARVGSFTLAEAHPLAEIEADARRRRAPARRSPCATSSGSTSTPSRRAPSPTASRSRPARSRCAATGPYALVGPDGDAARGLRAAAARRCSPRSSSAGGLSRADRRRPRRARRPRSRRASRCAWRGRHHRCVRRRAPRAPRGAAPRPRARRRARPRRGVRHLRPPPGRGRAARLRAEAAHHARAEARAARRDRLPRPRASCCTSTRRAAGSRPRTSCGRCWSTPRTPGVIVVGADFHFGQAPRRRRRAAPAHGCGARLRGARGRARGRARRHDLLVDRHPRAARRGRRRAAAALLGRPHEVRGTVVEGDRAAGSSGSPPPTWRCPARCCLPADGIYAGYVPRPTTASSGSPPSRSGVVPRSTSRPTRRCSRRTCSTSTATSTGRRWRCASSNGCAVRSSSTRSTRWSRRSPRRGGHAGEALVVSAGPARSVPRAGRLEAPAAGRREFLAPRGPSPEGVAVGGLQALGGARAVRSVRERLPQGRCSTQPSDCPIDTVVVLMMENRSFDHYLGWLGADEQYLERGRSALRRASSASTARPT